MLYHKLVKTRGQEGMSGVVKWLVAENSGAPFFACPPRDQILTPFPSGDMTLEIAEPRIECEHSYR